MTPKPTTPTEWINRHIRKCLAAKQQELRANTADLALAVLDQHKDAKQVRAAQAAINRNEKSLALLVAKSLCQHDAQENAMTINRSVSRVIRCGKCRTTTTALW